MNEASLSECVCFADTICNWHKSILGKYKIAICNHTHLFVPSLAPAGLGPVHRGINVTTTHLSVSDNQVALTV
eukprot:m.357972 g.357972  ORF g.357972 m.357972 type:complete len:73 (-) comp18000_c0_seq1:945-1163(-)